MSDVIMVRTRCTTRSPKAVDATLTHFRTNEFRHYTSPALTFANGRIVGNSSPIDASIDMTAVDKQMPERPQVVRLGSALFFLNAAVLFISWAFLPESTTSNGATVFFILLWISVGFSVYYGFGWVRYATLVVLLAFVWGLFNAPSVDRFLADMSTAEITSKIIPLFALIMLWIPDANSWFRTMQSQREPSAPSKD